MKKLIVALLKRIVMLPLCLLLNCGSIAATGSDEKPAFSTETLVEKAGIILYPMYDAETDEWGYSPYPSTYLSRWLLKRDQRPEEVLLIVKKHFNKNENAEAYDRVKEIVKNGLDRDGRHYVVLGAGSSGLRAGSFIMIDAAWKERILRWIQCGINTRRGLVANKYMVYIIMSLMSSTNPWSTKTDLLEPDIQKTVVLPDLDFVIKGLFDVVENGKVKRMLKKVTNKVSDGLMLYLVDDKKEYEAFTVRAPGWKALCVPVARSAFYRLMSVEKRKPLTDFTDEDWMLIGDAWGVRHDVREVQCIGFKSGFKWVKACKTLDEWKQYQNQFVALGHSWSICVTAHKKLGDMPYQQLQTLCWTQDEAIEAAQSPIERLEAYCTMEGAPKLLSGAMRKVAELEPSLMTDDYIFEEMCKSYISKRWRWMGGKAPGIGFNPFASADVYAIIQWVIGAKVTGLLPARTVHCRMFRYFVLVDATRCPHLDNAHAVRENIPVPEQWKGLYQGNTCFFSVYDATMNLLQMDFDGDHVFVTANKAIVKWALKAIAKHGNVPLWYEAKASKAPDEVTDEQIEKLLIELDPAPVGLYAFALNKLWARGDLTTAQKIYIALLTEGGNTCIDAAKYISDDGDAALAPETVAALEADEKMKNPLFIAYAKSSPFVEGSFDKRMKNSRFCRTSGIDQYCVAIRDNTSDELVVEGLNEHVFNWRVLTHGKVRRIPDLCHNASKDENGNWVAGGIFNELVFSYSAASDDLGESCKDDSYEGEKLQAQLQRYTTEEIRKYVLAYCEDHCVTDPHEVANSLVMAIYCSKEERQSSQLKRALWQCFGEEILDNVLQNHSVGYVSEECDPEYDQSVLDQLDELGIDESFAADLLEDDDEDLFDIDELADLE